MQSVMKISDRLITHNKQNIWLNHSALRGKEHSDSPFNIWKQASIRPVVFNLFAGAEPQENIPVARGTPVQ